MLGAVKTSSLSWKMLLNEIKQARKDRHSREPLMHKRRKGERIPTEPCDVTQKRANK